MYNKGDGHGRVNYYYYGYAPGDAVGSIQFQRANWGNVYYCLDEIEFAGGTAKKWSEAAP